MASARLPTQWGASTALGFERDISNGSRRVETALAILIGDLDAAHAPLVRIHSQCLTGELFCSLRCDCAAQLEVESPVAEKVRRDADLSRHNGRRGANVDFVSLPMSDACP